MLYILGKLTLFNGVHKMDGELDQWKKLANSEVKRMGNTVDDLVSKTLEGIDIKALYPAEDTKNLETIDS